MKTIFDASAMPFDQWGGLWIALGALLVTAIVMLRGGRRRWLFTGLGIAALLFTLAFLLPLADYRHVQSVVRSGKLLTAEGRLTGFKHEVERRFMGSSRGVGVTSSHNYVTITTEQFYIGEQWFWYEIGSFPSLASFTNVGDPPLKFRDGSWARVRYFKDGWYDDQARIVSFELRGGAQGGVGSSGGTGDRAFDAFWARFSAAASGGDAAGVKALTRFPFLFAGVPLAPDRFDSIWMGIFPVPNRPCFKDAVPVKDGAAWSVSCGAYVYVFEKGAEGWRLAAFTADGEALE